MTEEQKRQIAEQLSSYCAQKGSQNKAANSLKGVSSATISKVLTGQWDTISDEMWRGIAAQTGSHEAAGWQVVKTRAYDVMAFTLRSVQADSLTAAVIGGAGCGKTEAIRAYTAAGHNVYHMVCSEYWNRRTLMTRLMQQMGTAVTGTTVSEMMDSIVDALKRRERPLIVLDEADKLSDQVLYFFISLYNQLEDRCGIMLTATSHLKARIERGLRLNRKGYAEIYSRIGRKFVELPLPDSQDVARVCVANGVKDTRSINRIVEECDADLRRVRRSVWALQKGGEA